MTKPKASYYFPGLGGVSAAQLKKTEYFMEAEYDARGTYYIEGKDKGDDRTFYFQAKHDAVKEQAPKIQEAIDEVRSA